MQNHMHTDCMHVYRLYTRIQTVYTYIVYVFAVLTSVFHFTEGANEAWRTTGERRK